MENKNSDLEKVLQTTQKTGGAKQNTTGAKQNTTGAKQNTTGAKQNTTEKKQEANQKRENTTRLEILKQKEKIAVPINLGVLERHLDLSLLVRSANDSRPLTPEQVKKVFENFTDSLLVPPVSPPSPFFSRQAVEIEGLTPKAPPDYVKNTPELKELRKKAVLYTSALSSASRGFDYLRDLIQAGKEYERMVEEIGKKLDELRDSPDVVRKKEIIEREQQRLKEIAKAYADVSEFHKETIEQVNQILNDYRETLLENYYSEDFRKVFTVLSEAKTNEREYLSDFREKVLEKFEPVMDEALYASSLLYSEEGSIYKPSLSLKEKEIFRKYGDKEGVELWQTYYQPLAEAAYENSATHVVEQLKKMALVHAAYRRFLKQHSQEINDLVNQTFKRVEKELDEIVKEEVKRKIKNGEISKDDRQAQVQEAKRIYSELIEMEKPHLEKIEQIRNVLTKEIFPLNYKNFLESAHSPQDFAEKLRNFKELPDETKQEIISKLYDIEDISWKNEFNFETDEKLINLSASLYNARLLLEKAKDGQLPLDYFRDKDLRKRLSAVSNVPDNVLESIKAVAEQSRTKKEVLFKRPPLNTSEYLQIIRDVKTLEFANRIAKRNLFEKAKDFANKLEKRNSPLAGLVKKAGFGMQAYFIAFHGDSVRFNSCMQTVAFPSDTGFNEKPSSRLRQCIERYMSDIKRSQNEWEQKVDQMASLNPANPFLAPFYLYAMTMTYLKAVQNAYLKNLYLKYETELKREAENVLFSTTPNTVDERARELIRETLGIDVKVKPNALLTFLETTPEVEEFKDVCSKFFNDKPQSGEELQKFLREYSYKILPEFAEVNSEAYGKLLKITESLQRLSTLKPATDKEAEKKEKMISSLLNELEEVTLKEAQSNNFIALTVTGKENSAVIRLNADRLREMGLGGALSEVKSFPVDSMEFVTAKRRLFNMLGLDEDTIKLQLDKGEVKNGMEYMKVFSNIMNSLAFRTGKLPIPEKETAIPSISKSNSADTGIEL